MPSRLYTMHIKDCSQDNGRGGTGGVNLQERFCRPVKEPIDGTAIDQGG